MIVVRAIDLRERRVVEPGLGDATDPGFPFSGDWMCSMCRIGEHDGCLGEIKICYCPVCWGDDDDNQTEDQASMAT